MQSFCARLCGFLRSGLDEFVQICRRGDAQYKLAACICYDGELLLSASIHSSLEERLELLQRCLSGDDLVAPTATLELVHGLLDRIAVADLAFLEQLLQTRNANVSQQGTVLLGDDGKVGVVALKSGHESPGDGVGRLD
jgi:hypothetical protein